jgi:hypothetical protein
MISDKYKGIGISGKLASGKTFAVDVITRLLNVSILKITFAQQLKQLINYLHEIEDNWNKEEINGILDACVMQYLPTYYERHRQVFLGICEKQYQIPWDPVKPRERLQLVGTDGFRAVAPNVWVDVHKGCCKLQKDSFILVDDVRFPNELTSLLLEKFFVIRINPNPDKRTDVIKTLYPNLKMETLSHASETSLDLANAFNYIWNNDYDKISERNLEQIILEC